MASADPPPLQRLKDMLGAAQKNSGQMLTKLQNFEDRLKDIDMSMVPIQEKTMPLMRARQNIGDTLVEIEKTYEYFRISGDLEHVISRGVKDNQTDFFEAVDRLSVAQDFFLNQRNMKSTMNALASIDALIKRAMAHCVDEVERLLRQCGKCYEVVNNTFEPDNPMQPATAEAIKQVCGYLNKFRQVTHLNVYKSLRVAQAKADLKAFEQSQQLGWDGVLSDKSSPYAAGKHPFEHYYALAFSILRGELQMWGTALTSSEDSISVFLSVCEAVLNEMSRVLSPYTSVKGHISVLKQCNALLVRLDVLDIFFSEFVQLKELCSGTDHGQRNLALDSLYLLRNELAEATMTCAVDVLQCLQADSSGSGSASQGLLDACDLHPTTGHVLCCCKELAVVGSVAYTEVLSIAVENQVDVSEMPPTLALFEAEMITLLMQRLQTIAGAYDRDKKGQKSGSRGTATAHHSMFEHDEKEGEERIVPAKKHLFMLNNLFNVLVHLRGRVSSLADLNTGGNDSRLSMEKAQSRKSQGGLKSANTSIQSLSSLSTHVDERVTHEQTHFCTVLANALILDSIKELQVAVEKKEVTIDRSGKVLKLNDGRKLKAIFGSFNSSMDTLQVLQADWRISSPDLRKNVRSQLMASILPVYTDFFNTYSVVNFSKKHMGEYLKYPPTSVEKILTSLFS